MSFKKKKKKKPEKLKQLRQKIQNNTSRLHSTLTLHFVLVLFYFIASKNLFHIHFHFRATSTTLKLFHNHSKTQLPMVYSESFTTLTIPHISGALLHIKKETFYPMHTFRSLEFLDPVLPLHHLSNHFFFLGLPRYASPFSPELFFVILSSPIIFP